jgi:hypothetical protein
MSYGDFLNTLSYNIADKFGNNYYDKVEYKESPSSETTNNKGGKSYFSANEWGVELKKEGFFNLVTLEENENKEQFFKKMWKKLESEYSAEELKPKYNAFETIVTDALRKRKVSDVDCSRLEYRITENEAKLEVVLMFFRKDASFATQRPQKFAPLYKGSYDRMQELKQGEYSIAKSTFKKPVLSTWHLANCVAFIAFNKISGIGVVAHIDTCGDCKDLFDNLKDKLLIYSAESLESDKSLVFDYVLIGGVKKDENSIESHRETIIKAADDAADKEFKFNFIEAIGEEIAKEDFKSDCVWGYSMRLQRSVALDTTMDSPLEKLMSYEPWLNKKTSLKTRTEEENKNFENKREEEKNLNFVTPEE